MQQAGNFSISPILAVQIINFFNMLACFSYGWVGSYFKQKNALLFSQIGCVLCHCATILFNETGQSALLIISLVLFICCFQYGIGTIALVHTFETCVDSIVGLGLYTLYLGIFVTALVTPTLFTLLGETGFFAVFASASTLMIIFSTFRIRDTDYWIVDEKTGKKVLVKMTERAKKELYWPKEFLEGKQEEPSEYDAVNQ